MLSHFWRSVVNSFRWEGNMEQKLRCPFVDSPCVEDNCMGWRQDYCFIDELAPRMRGVKLPSDGKVDQIKIEKARDQTPPIVADMLKQHQQATESPKIGIGRIWLGIDLGTAYSKLAYRIEPGPPNFIEIRAGEWVMSSDIVIEQDAIRLADLNNMSRIQDVKTQFRRDTGNGACLSVKSEEQAITTFEGMLYLYYVLVRRALDSLPEHPQILRITVPALAFSSSEELQDRYREVMDRAYSLAAS